MKTPALIMLALFGYCQAQVAPAPKTTPPPVKAPVPPPPIPVPADRSEAPVVAPVEPVQPSPTASPAANAPAPSATAAPDAKDKADKWDVSAQRGPTVTATIDTTSGTWLSLDVSPDGNTIVFDLLGDLYLLPITGGDAKPLTSGIAWDMQPAFSPDGKRIAFTSDRGGGDNLWTITIDGTLPHQVTKESFRLLNGPAWLPPDGQYIVGQKHFTSRRSLGAGEMWLYHASAKDGGGEGLQMTTRPTEQKGVGEPAFSPDGQYLYYSLDSTPGANFEYNKDSARGIYSVNRLDRTTGEEESFISGPGGACRPTPSPDSKQIAFVRRLDFVSTLFIKDLESGNERAVYSPLERDMQEAWAIHGVYPRFAWMPDSQSIVLYAKGGFHKINCQSGAATPIPFHVKDTRVIQRAVRFPVDVAPVQFDVKMMRNPVLRPDGKQVAFNALGYIYVKDLPEGAPRRLTTQTDRFEYPGAYSRDSERLVFTTWNDTELASIRTISSTGTDEQAITKAKGHYVDPTFSPDGKTVVFGKVSGGYLISPLFSDKPGLYRVPSDGSAPPTLITKRGTNPQFGPENDRVYLTTVESRKDNDKRSFISIGLDGTHERAHNSSENATEFRIAPDGRYLAFAERFNVYITPFVPTGREVAIGPKSSSQPLVKVSTDGSVNLQWSGDNQTLYWSLGPTVYARKVSDAFESITQTSEAVPAAPADPSATTLATATSTTPITPITPPATLIPIGFTAPYAAPAGDIFITGATLLTMTRSAAIPGNTPAASREVVVKDGTVHISGNRIMAAGPAADITIPSGAKVIDATGKFIMPGIIDVHAHGAQGANGFTPQQNWINVANLAFGVTTIHDPSNDTESIFAASELAKSGAILAPRIFSTGTILYGAAGSFKAEVDSLEDARSHLRRLKAVGAFSVKSYNQPRRDQRQQIIAAARELNMMVVPEGGSLFEHNMTMIVDGHTGIEHTLPVECIYDDVRDLWKSSSAGYTPTLIVAYGGLDGEHYWYDQMDVWQNERLLRFVPRMIVEPRSRRRPRAPQSDYNVLRVASIAREVVEAGSTAQLGAHGQLAGLGAHWELWSLTAPGVGNALSNTQALRAATIDGAKYLGFDNDLGSIESGKLADLLILEKDPREEIKNSLTITHTVANGIVYNAADMSVVAPTPAPGPTFWFKDFQRGQATALMMARFAHTCAGCGRVGGDHGGEHVSHGESREGYR